MPKRIQLSVGQGGKNLPADVATVQYLLNCVPAWKGGPAPELAVDGLVGPKTIAAIRKFQTASFRRADGRVDPGARTLRALHGYDPYPEQPVAFGPGGKSFAGAFGTGKQGGPAGQAGGKQGAGGAAGGSWGKQGAGTPWGKNNPGGGSGKSF